MSDFPSLSGAAPDDVPEVAVESERGSIAGAPSDSGTSVDRELNKLSISSPTRASSRAVGRPESGPSQPISRPSSTNLGGLAAAVGAERSRPQSRGGPQPPMSHHLHPTAFRTYVA